jgi:hypothetical protein
MMDTYHTIEEKWVFPLRMIDNVYYLKTFLNGYIKGKMHFFDILLSNNLNF